MVNLERDWTWDGLANAYTLTVERDGQVVGTVPTKTATKQSLAHMMVGREVLLQYEQQETKAGATCLKIENLRAQSDRSTPALRGVNLEIRAGEILGLAGVSGNGQRELAECLAGFRWFVGHGCGSVPAHRWNG